MGRHGGALDGERLLSIVKLKPLIPMRIDTSAKDAVALKAMAERGPTGSTITVSLRDLMLITGLGRGTIDRSIKRLIGRGHIARLKSSRHTQHARRYRVLESPATDHQTSFLWSKHGLGASALLIHCVMPADVWMTVRQLRELLGCSESTIRTALLKLHSAGLVNGLNSLDDRRANKREWMRLNDDDYLKFYEEWLTRPAQESVNDKVKREQAEWRFIERSRLRGSQPHGHEARAAQVLDKTGTSSNPSAQ